MGKMNSPMVDVEFSEFDDGGFPEGLRSQVLTFLRVTAPEGFEGELRYRDWITRPELEPYHLLYVARGLVVSHLEIIRATLEHEAVEYELRSITGVLTFPSFRHEGWASRLVREAVRRIDVSGADIGIVYCDPALAGLYASCGWSPMERVRTVIGPNREDAAESRELALVRLLSEKGRAGMDRLSASPIWLRDEW